MSSEESTGSFATGMMSPLARRSGGEPARRCRSDALLETRARSRLSIFSSARLPPRDDCAAEAAAAGAGRASPREGAGDGAAGVGIEMAADVGVKPATDGTADGFVFGEAAVAGAMRAPIFPF